MSWFKNLFKRAKSKLSKVKITTTEIVGYLNGDCPICDTHIGTDVHKNTLTGKLTARCGACGNDIYPKLDEYIQNWFKDA